MRRAGSSSTNLNENSKDDDEESRRDESVVMRKFTGRKHDNEGERYSSPQTAVGHNELFLDVDFDEASGSIDAVREPEHRNESENEAEECCPNDEFRSEVRRFVDENHPEENEDDRITHSAAKGEHRELCSRIPDTNPFAFAFPRTEPFPLLS